MNRITTLEDANFYLQRYGLAACLEEIRTGKKAKNKRYHFVNVPPIQNFPYGFKTVAKAMNCLELHESGAIAKIRQRKKWKRLQQTDEKKFISSYV